MPDAPALAALREKERHAENEVLHLALRLANWDPPSVMDLKDAPLLEAHARALTAYRDAVAARVRAELAAPREPGEAEQLTGVLDWFNGDGESLVYRAILDWAEDGNYNAKHVAQYACEAIARRLRDKLRAARPDARDGRPDGAATS